MKGLGDIEGVYKTDCLSQFIEEVTLNIISTENNSKKSIIYYYGLKFKFKYASMN